MNKNKTNQNTHPDNIGIPQSCILHLLASPSLGNPSSVFCLLSSVFCLLLKPPIQPILPGVYDSIMQNKANSLKPATTATSSATKIYNNIALRLAQENKANQTQFRPRPDSHSGKRISTPQPPTFSPPVLRENPPRPPTYSRDVFSSFWTWPVIGTNRTGITFSRRISPFLSFVITSRYSYPERPLRGSIILPPGFS